MVFAINEFEFRTRATFVNVSGKREPLHFATRPAAAPGPAWIMVQGGRNQRLCIFQKDESLASKPESKGLIGVAVTSKFLFFPGIFIPSGKHDGMYLLRIFLITALCFVDFG